MKVNIATKISALAFGLVLVTAWVVGIVTYTNSNAILVRHDLESLKEGLRLQGIRVLSDIDMLRQDVMFLSRTPPIQGIIRAQMAGGIDPQDSSTEALWRQRLGVIFTAFLRSKPSYFQVRYIGVANGGRELVRVERSGNTLVTVADEDLQGKGGRPYFQEAIQLKADEVYLSDITLNRENGRLSEPHIPVLRVAVPIYSVEGKPFGIVLINKNYAPLLEPPTASQFYYYVTNDVGDILAHRDPAMTFGFDLGERHLIQGLYPELAVLLEPGYHSRELSCRSLTDDRDHMVHGLKVAFDPLHAERSLVLVQAAPYGQVMANSISVRNRTLVLVLFMMVGSVVLAFFLSRFLTRPLTQITQAVEDFAEGSLGNTLPVQVGDEIGLLAQAFQTMTQQVQEQARKLQESEVRARAVVETAVDGIITIDEQGLIETFNSAAERLFGYAADEVVGQNIAVLMPSPHREEHTTYLARYLNTGAAKIIGLGREVLGQRRDRTTFPLDLSVSEVRLGEQRIFTGILRDLTERKQLEESLRQSQKAEVVGQLTAGIAHNFNNRLMVILNSFEHVLLKSTFDAEILKHGEEAAKKAVAIVQQLMLFSRADAATEYRPIQLQSVIQETVAIGQKIFDRKIVLLDEVPGDLPLVSGDRNQLEQVFLNLLLNARDALDAGNPALPNISVEATTILYQEVDLSEHASSPPGEYVCIRMADNGVGMDEETQGRIFEPFFTTKKAGTGLGLATVHTIIREHRGWVACESQVGVGSTFSVYLPVAEVERSSPEVEQENDALPSGTETILLIEDEEPVLDTLRLMCSRQGYKILEAHNGQEGWEVFQRERARIDLVLLDLSMPEMSGQELMAQMLDLDPEVKVIISTGYTQYQAESLGARALLPKPYGSRQALQTIRQVLDE